MPAATRAMMLSSAAMQDRFANANDPRAVRSREALHRALLTLLESKQIDQITIRDIAAESGVGYTTYFRHYPTKEALFEAVVAEQIDGMFKVSLPMVDAQDVQSAAMALFAYVRRNSRLWITLLTGNAAGTVREQLLRRARAVAAPRSRADAWMPPEVGVILIVGGLIELLGWWLQQRHPIPIERVTEIFVRVVMTPAIAAGDAPPVEGSQKPKPVRRKA